MMKIAIIDYGSGNLRSAQKAFERAAHEAGIEADVALSADPAQVSAADRIVLPGVGAYRDCRDGLNAIPDMWRTLDKQVRQAGKPFLGICVGMQLMAERGLEHGETDGFGWIAGDVAAIAPQDKSLKVPHMGWNTLDLARQHPVFDGLATGDDGLHAYFVHSYHFVPATRADRIATTDYGGTVTAFLARDNVVGSQFHPEKSQKLGLALIANFLKWKP